eukprot:gb/GEZN01007706.1/.p1 GENE.gb/GEZN01007706.1/~~gb/GEZN01007706.1/.p1  ORF type:complete len:316 (-),score=56.00 gb/GEZN01007706.1/:433-1380(-)
MLQQLQTAAIIFSSTLQLTGAFLELGEYECSESTWDQNLETCGKCKVLTNMAKDYGSCNWFCGAQEGGLVCTGAWEDDADNCVVKQEYDCHDDFYDLLDTKDMICECSTEEYEQDLCHVELWDKDFSVDHRGRYCGSCKALTLKAATYDTCDKFCKDQEDGRACVGAWSDYNGNCGVNVKQDCDYKFATVGGADSMICECSHVVFGDALRSYDVRAKSAKKEAKPGQKVGIAFAVMFVLSLVAMAVYLAYDLHKKKNTAIKMALRAPLTPPRTKLRLVSSTSVDGDSDAPEHSSPQHPETVPEEHDPESQRAEPL